MRMPLRESCCVGRAGPRGGDPLVLDANYPPN